MRGLRRLLIVCGVVVASLAGAATMSETFATDPRARGWRTWGDTNLWHWQAASQQLAVTWDSSKSNSFLHVPLGTVLSTGDVFSIAFDLRMNDLAIGTSSNKPYTFQLALGLVNSGELSLTNRFRGLGQFSASSVRNTFEFNYFPDSGFGATFAPTVVSTNARVAFSDNHPLVLTTGDVFRITMSYSNLMLRTTVTRNGLPYGLPPTNSIKNLALATYPDFRVDTLAIINWSDAVQAGSPVYWGSILAHGIVDNLELQLPEPPVRHLDGGLTNGQWRGVFVSRTQWLYALERTTNCVTWQTVSPTNAGTGGPLTLQDSAPPAGVSTYRVRAWK